MSTVSSRMCTDTLQNFSRSVTTTLEGIQNLPGFLQTYDSHLNFATNAWTSPNHWPFVAVTVHMEKDGQPMNMLLDIVELLVLHSRVNLAAAFVNILRSYRIEHKVIDTPTALPSNTRTRRLTWPMARSMTIFVSRGLC